MTLSVSGETQGQACSMGLFCQHGGQMRTLSLCMPRAGVAHLAQQYSGVGKGMCAACAGSASAVCLGKPGVLSESACSTCAPRGLVGLAIAAAWRFRAAEPRQESVVEQPDEAGQGWSQNCMRVLDCVHS